MKMKSYLIGSAKILGTFAAMTFTVAAWGQSESATRTPAQPSAPFVMQRASVAKLLDQYCSDCHRQATEAADKAEDKTADEGGPTAWLQRVDWDRFSEQHETWENVVRRLRARQMPPPDAARPSETEYRELLTQLEGQLDADYTRAPQVGRTETLRRLTRTEYQNAIRDLLALDIDAAALLPPDESSHGFDNITVGELSPTLMHRYVLAAQRIARLAVGGAQQGLAGDTIRVKPDVTQEEHIEGLPLGTRGGVLIPYTFPVEGDYDIQVRLARDRNEEVEGLTESHELEIIVDRERIQLWTVAPPRNKDFSKVDAHLKTRIHVTGGPHELGVTFIKNPSSLLETKRQPYQAHYNMHRHPRLGPAVYEVSITGPYAAVASGDTPSRQKVFIAKPTGPSDEKATAEKILGSIARIAFRRPIDDTDLEGPMAFYQNARQAGADFESGIEMGLSSLLVNPNFLFRIELEPADAAAGSVYRVRDIDLASRLAFFLWSSLPDDELLSLAEAGKLSSFEALQQQVSRMLADKRAQALTKNFADQWLYLRNIESLTPDLRLFPDFDDNLRQAFRQETELFFESIIHENRSVLDLIRADYTYLNERLAKHYGIPHIYGSRFRRVPLDEASHRGGLLRHGSILTVTSYATRTSPVIRGHWILKNLVGIAPPPPPANVPALKDSTISADLTVRQRLAEHRANPACASCHQMMDPIGFALENFDAIGRWRDMEAGLPVDASGAMLDGATFDGIDGLEANLLKQPELFVGTMVEKLMTFALGRGVDYHDGPAVRRIVREASRDDYRFEGLVQALVRSEPFLKRTAN